MKKIVYSCLVFFLVAFIGHISFNTYMSIQESRKVKTSLICFATEYRKSNTGMLYTVEVYNWTGRIKEIGSIKIESEATRDTSSYLNASVNKKFSLHNQKVGDLELTWKSPSYFRESGFLEIYKTEYLKDSYVDRGSYFTGWKFTGIIAYNGYQPISFYMTCPESSAKTTRETRISTSEALSRTIEYPLSFYRYNIYKELFK